VLRSNAFGGCTHIDQRAPVDALVDSVGSRCETLFEPCVAEIGKWQLYTIGRRGFDDPFSIDLAKRGPIVEIDGDRIRLRPVVDGAVNLSAAELLIHSRKLGKIEVTAKAKTFRLLTWSLPSSL
jgi:hypothetical protein